MIDSINDVIIIGSGPAGYTAAIYLGRAGIKPVLISGLLDSGGALMNTGLVENYAGFPDGIPGPELMQNMQSQAKKFNTDILVDDVIEVDFASDIKTLTLSDNSILKTKAVIVTTGAKYRHLGVLGEDEFAGKGVSYCATCDGFFFKDKAVAVVGGGDTAVGEAIFLSSLASKVTIIHRRDQLRATATIAAKAKSIPNIEFAWDSIVEEVKGDDAGVKSLELKNVHSLAKSQIDCSGVFVAIGHNPSTGIFRGKLKLNDLGYVIVNSPSTATSQLGVFAAGDCVDSKYRQAIIAAASGAKAALDVDEFLKGVV
ncbi:MAG: thioredoxin-disulfide reductase [Bifidobacteriaceae bacterium]|nr:thioredoxin-disulfide reductase [Bifidobacteriaceae bacterium]